MPGAAALYVGAVPGTGVIALPAWLAQGSHAGDVPRRSLGVMAAFAAIALMIAMITGVGPRPFVMLTTGSLVTVYVLGTAAALKLLPRRSWAHRCARIALVAVIALCCTTGWYMLWPLAVSGCALLYLRAHRRTQLSNKFVDKLFVPRETRMHADAHVHRHCD